ncbi:MAG TPA: DUF1499 domain-containing protein [Hellea balneolensis]|uniref:DUF1499 domain-containing protein n=1 Tax=Hellea balneolensis TaxID=287478 RepID=A0A7C5LS43_9PROT|nr:DUF1499 domain-containing protein [Hellea balneolensis]
MRLAAIVFVWILVILMVLFYLLGRKSQKGSAPGMVDGRLAPCSSKPNCVSSEDGTPDDKKVRPFRGVPKADIKRAITVLGGHISREDDRYLAAEFTSKLYKFVDDLELRFDGDITHIRSASRVGYSDRGVNRRRVEALHASINEDNNE